MKKLEDKFLETLIEALNILAADYLVQMEAFPDFVFLPDEVISIFSEAYLLFPQIIESELVNECQISSVENVKIFIGQMGDKSEQDIWSMEAMKIHPDWKMLRSFAKDALVTFGKMPELPDLRWITYIRGGKDLDTQ